VILTISVCGLNNYSIQERERSFICMVGHRFCRCFYDITIRFWICSCH